MSDIRCIAISTGGGDAPGLNAVIRAAVKAAILKYKWKIIGIQMFFGRELSAKNIGTPMIFHLYFQDGSFDCGTNDGVEAGSVPASGRKWRCNECLT